MKTFIFDFDGTIANTLPVVLKIMRELDETSKFVDIEEDEAFVERYKSMPMKTMLRELKISLPEALIIVTKIKKVLKERLNEVEVFPGLKDVLFELRKKGINLGVVTSNNKETAEKFLKDQNLLFFDFIYDSHSLFGKNKILKKVLKKHSLNPDETLYIGDEVRDIKASEKVGIKIAAVTWGYNNKDILEKEKPDFMIDDPNQLLTI